MQINAQVKNQKLIKEKHRQIAQAAASLFIKKGFHQTTIREIADSSQMSMGLLYKYISSKDDVLFLVYKELSDQFFIALSKVKIQKAKSPIEKLKTSMKEMLNLVHDNPKKFLFLYTESKFLSPLALKSVLSMESRVIEHFRIILEEGRKIGLFNIKEPLLTASIIVYLLMIGPLRGWSYRKKCTADFSQEYLINFCLKAISKNKVVGSKHKSSDLINKVSMPGFSICPSQLEIKRFQS